MLIIKVPPSQVIRNRHMALETWRQARAPPAALGTVVLVGSDVGSYCTVTVQRSQSMCLRLVNTQMGLNNKYPGAQARERASLLPQYRHSSQIWLIEIMHRTKSPVWWDLTKMIIGWNCLSLIPTYLTFQLPARLKQTAPIYCSRPLIMDTLPCTLPHYRSGQAVNTDSCHFWQIVASKMNGGSHMTT